MPYYISNKNPDCAGWAVVKADGELVACQKTKQDAIDNALAISLSEDEEYMGELGKDDSENRATYTPPAGVRNAAKRALEWIAEGKAGSGFTDVGRRRASQLANGEPVSDVTIARMRSYFARHEVDKQATGFSSGEDGYPSPGRVAWDAWGGDAGQTWSNTFAENRAAGDKIIICDIDGTMLNGSNRNNKVWDYVESLEGLLFMVTGRPESDRANTVQDLADADVRYSRLIMNPGSTADSVDYKRETAKRLLENYEVVVAIENNPDALRAYRSLGINAKSPASLPTVNEDNGNERDVESNKLDAGVFMTENRSKWLPVAYALIARVEGGTPEMRNLGGAEHRTYTFSDIEVREEGDGMMFTGYAARFNEPSHPLPFIEVIAPGAFKRSLQSRSEIKLLWNHDAGEPLASLRGGSLRLSEDELGLKVEAQLANTNRGRDTAELIRSKVIDSMSFGFNVIKDSWSNDGSQRTLQDVRLFETSIVSFPAYESTAGSLQVRSISAEALADSLAKLESGENLDADQANLLREVVDKLSGTPAEVVPEEPVGDLALAKAKLFLLQKAV